MTCPECKENRGCSCNFVKTDKRDYKVCPDCKLRLENLSKIQNEPKGTKPNMQGV